MFSTILFYVILIPLSVLFHELGHGLASLIFTKYSVRIYLGPDNETNNELFSLGRIRFHFKLSYFGKYHLEGDNIKLTTSERILISLGGPVFSLILVFSSLLVIYINNFKGETRSLIIGILIFNLVNFLITIIPVKYPSWYKPYAGMSSDGYKVLMAIRDKKNQQGSISK